MTQQVPDLLQRCATLHQGRCQTVPQNVGAYITQYDPERGLRQDRSYAADTCGPVKLWVNADGLSPQSSLRVELLDMMERPLPGYSGEHAATADQSGLRMPVIWKGKSQTADLKRAFKIKVNFEGSLRGAISFYALYVSE